MNTIVVNIVVVNSVVVDVVVQGGVVVVVFVATWRVETRKGVEIWKWWGRCRRWGYSEGGETRKGGLTQNRVSIDSRSGRGQRYPCPA